MMRRSYTYAEQVGTNLAIGEAHQGYGKRSDENEASDHAGMPYNGSADHLQTSPARPLRGTAILRQLARAAFFCPQRAKA